MDVFDIEGRRVESLMNRDQNQGTHQVSWHPRHQASGIYFIRIGNEPNSIIRRVVLNP